MSCRRSHRARFIGCRVGEVRIRGCSRGCCSYPSSTSEIERNERWNYLRLAAADEQRPPVPRNIVHGLPVDLVIAPGGHHPCKNPYKPKFVCVGCGRVFKFSALPGNTYYENQRPPGLPTSGWWMQYEMKEDWLTGGEASTVMAKWAVEKKCMVEKMIEQQWKGVDNGFKEKEIDDMRPFVPDLRCKPLKSSSCPECGKKGLPIGDTFRPPRKRDDQGWARVSRMISEGERFSYCMTEQEESDLFIRARRLLTP